MMTGKERIMRIFKGKEIDRPALKLWGIEVGQQMLHPAYKPVYELAMKTSDIMGGASSKLDVLFGSENSHIITVEDKPLPDINWVDRHTFLELPEKKLHSVQRYSRIGEPGYDLEHFVKDPDDLKALLSIGYEPYPIDMTSYNKGIADIGDKGIVIFHIDHPAYAVQRIMGSECFALMCIDQRELLKEVIDLFAKRIREHVKNVLNTGIKPVFGWVGPELCIPPLVRMSEFEEFVFDMDKPLCDLIHNAGCHVWVHCHGRVGKLLSRFMEMGIDVLNPLEPSPLGDINLEEAIKKVGNGMGLEGNIEISSLLLGKQDEVRELIYNLAMEGKKSKRFIMCPSAGYMEYVNPSPEYINNLLLYLEYGLECLT